VGTDFPLRPSTHGPRAEDADHHPGITRLFAVLGGSMGGMQVLQWAASYPDAVFAALPIACAAYHSVQNIAFHEVGRQAISPTGPAGRALLGECIPARASRWRGCAHHLSVRGGADPKFGRRLQNAPATRAEAIGLFGEMLRCELPRHQGSTFVTVRCQFVSDDHAAMDYFDLAADYTAMWPMRSKHEDAVRRRRSPRTAVPDRGKPRDRTDAEPGGANVSSWRSHRQGSRRVPAGRAGFHRALAGLAGC
jgi:homoserine O-acetyltransferase